MEEGKKFVIIDALAIAYKAYFAFISRPLQNSKGEPTSAVYGFLAQLFKIIEDTRPDYIAIAYDSKEKTFRHEIYDLYKSSRAEMPDDMIPQIARIREVVEAFNIKQYILPGYEADDIIGTAVKKAEADGFESFAITPDKDYIQLITDKIKIIKPGKRTDEIEIIDKEKATEKYGFPPELMIDYLALVGDSSDDIPGVKGIGPKTAVPLLLQFGSIENIYENIGKIEKQAVKNKLIENRENAFLSKKLATIVTDVPMEFNFEETKFVPPDFDKALGIFRELEFKNFGSRLNRLFNSANEANGISAADDEQNEETEKFDKDKVNYTLIKDESEAKKLAEKLSDEKLFVFDVETDSLDYFEAHLAGVSFSFKKGEAYFVITNPFIESRDLFAKDLSDRISLEAFVEIFKPVFENENIKKVCQNGKYDISILRTHGIETKNFYFDTMLASYVLDPDQKHNMDSLSEKYLNYSPIPLTELIGAKKNPELIFDVDEKTLCDYAAEDSDITFRLYKKLSAELKKENLEKVAYEIEFPLAPVLEDMERAGVKVDKKALDKFSARLEKMIDEYKKKIWEIAGEEFNINSTKQLQVILFDKLNLPKSKKTKTGFSTNAASLEALKGKHEIVDTLLDFRQVTKLRNTYVDALPKLIHPKTGRIHTTFNQTVASTGRLSSFNPNLQNIPIRTELGKEIRKAFIAGNDSNVLLSADYSQIELRIMASICEDEALMKAFQNKEDIHRSTAALVFMVSPEEVTPDMRRKAKEVNFGILYGIGAFGLKNRLGLTQRHAQEIIDTYFNTFKNVKAFIDDSIQTAKAKGYAETLLGRRRYLRNINSSNRTVRQFEERVAINMPIQGTAADMIKIAMINIFKELEKRKSATKMVLQVHDELIFDMPQEEAEEIKPVIIDLMENALPLKVPVVVDAGIGKNWLEAH